jgi:muconolactone delta-isomerase
VEFLVEFEVKIPAETPASEIADRENAEAVAAAKLVNDGHLARVWKAAGAAGDSRIVGLYRADSAAQLDGLLGALPLADWMHLTVTPLEPHPSDPASAAAKSIEYLVTMTTAVPAGTPADAVDEIRGREAAHSKELAAQGQLLRLWRAPLQPGEWRSIGLFSASDAGQLEEILASMPLRVWRTDVVTPLSPHPNDPAQTSS